MSSLEIKLCRPFDREPGDHLYGEPFDSAIETFVGGKKSWSASRDDRSANPTASSTDKRFVVTLHEDGPTFQFLVENWKEIAEAIGALSALIQAWYAARTFRTSQLPPDDFLSEGGTKITVNDVQVLTKRNLSIDELCRVARAVAEATEKRVP